MKYAFWVPIVISAIPLIIYPFVLLANLMSLAAEPTAESIQVPLWFKLVVYGFLWGSSLYPLALFGCGIWALARSRQNAPKSAILIALIPMAYLAILAVLFIVWQTQAK
jgi:hypothetical protein